MLSEERKAQEKGASNRRVKGGCARTEVLNRGVHVVGPFKSNLQSMAVEKCSLIKGVCT